MSKSVCRLMNPSFLGIFSFTFALFDYTDGV